MKQGRIVFLNGLTSSGKSTVAGILRDLAVEPVYVVSNDLFHGMTARKFWVQDYWGMVAHSIGVQYFAARAMADSGCTVVIDGMLLDLDEYVRHFGKRNLELVRSVFEGCPFALIDLVCPLEELRRRNLLRGNRGEFQSEEQSRRMTRGIPADLTLDVMTTLPDEAAAKILDFCGIPREPVFPETSAALCESVLTGLLSPIGGTVSRDSDVPGGFTAAGCASPDRAAELLLAHGWNRGSEHELFRLRDGTEAAQVRFV